MSMLENYSRETLYGPKILRDKSRQEEKRKYIYMEEIYSTSTPPAFPPNNTKMYHTLHWTCLLPSM